MFKKSGLSAQLQKGPDLSELHQLLSQALENRGKHMQLSWCGGSNVLFILDLLCHFSGGDPLWSLYLKKGKNQALVFDYSSCDVLLIYNLVLSAVKDAQPPEQMARLAKTPDKETPAASTPPVINPEPAAVPQSVPVTVAIPDATAMPAAVITASSPEEQSAAKPSPCTAQPASVSSLNPPEPPLSSEPVEMTDKGTLAEKESYLQCLGVQSLSTFVQKNPHLDEFEFVHKAGPESPVALETLAKFYLSLDGSQSLEELVRAKRTPYAQLVSMIYHLAINDLIAVVPAAAPQKTLTLVPRPIDTGAIESIMMSLRSLDTGMFMYPAFLYFLEQEYFRSYRMRSSFSIVVFAIREAVTNDGRITYRALPTEAIVQTVSRISRLKRYIDLIAHYDAFDYVLLLPNTKAAGARTLANRIVNNLLAHPISGVNSSRLSLAFGVSSVPEDFTNLGSLLGAADLAFSHSQHTRQPVVLYNEIKQSVT